MVSLKFAIFILFSFSGVIAPPGDENLNVVDIKKLLTVTYDGVCDGQYMTNFHHVFFMKSFFNYELRPSQDFPLLNREIVEEMKKFQGILEGFIRSIQTEIAEQSKYTGFYLSNKLGFLMEKASLITEHPMTELSKSQQQEDKKLESDRQNLRAELLVTKLDITYLENAKKQYVQALNGEEKAHVGAFQKELLPVLNSILKYVLKNYRKHSEEPEMRYVIDFFNVFGSLLGDKEFAEMILGHLVGHEPKPIFKDPSHPEFIADEKLYKIDNLESSPYKPIIAVDKLFEVVDPSLRVIENIVSRHNEKYTHHPEFLSFFDIPKKENPLKLNDPVKLKKVTDKGHKYIYYVYAHFRNEGKIPKGKSKKEVVDILYDELLNTKCYTTEAKTCNLSQLIPPSKFNKYFVIMLTLLKPETSHPTGFSQPEIKKITETGIDLGIEEASKYVPAITDTFKDFTNSRDKSIATAVFNEIEDKLNEAAKDLQIKIDSIDDPKDFNDIKKLVEKEQDKIQDVINKGFPELIKAVKPTIEKDQNIKPEDIKLPNFDIVDKDIEVLKNFADEQPEPQKTILDAIIKDTVGKLNDNFANDKSPEEDIEKIQQINKKLNDRIAITIAKKSNLNDMSGFIKYLTYTIQETIKSNTNREERRIPFFRDEKYESLRQLDIYVFYYLALKEKHGEEEARQTIMYAKSAFKEDLFDAFELGTTIINQQAGLEYLSRFFSLFSQFESNQVANEDEKLEPHSQNSHPKYVSSFNKLYKFICDQRLNGEMMHEDVDTIQWKYMDLCLKNQHHFITTGQDLIDPEGKYEELQEHHPCHLSYGDLSEIYPFYILHAYQFNANVKNLHNELFNSEHSELFLVNIHKFYNYLRDSPKTTLHVLYNNFCHDVTIKDSLCYGKEIYDIFVKLISENKLSSLETASVFKSLFLEKLKEIKGHFGGDEKRFRNIIWNILSGLGEKTTGDEYTSNHALHSMIYDVALLNFKTLQYEATYVSKNPEVADHLNKYVALKYFLSSQESPLSLKISKGVDYIIEKGDHVDLISKPTFMAGIGKLFVDYTTSIVNQKKVLDVFISHNEVQNIFIWGPKENSDFFRIQKEVENLSTVPQFGSQIINYINLNLRKAPKVDVTPVKGVVTKPVLPLPKKKQIGIVSKMTTTQTTVKKMEEKLQPEKQSEQPIIGQGEDEFAEEDDLVFAGYNTINTNGKIESKLHKSPSTGKGKDGQLTVVNSDDFTHAIAKKIVQNNLLEDIKKLLRRRLVVL